MRVGRTVVAAAVLGLVLTIVVVGSFSSAAYRKHRIEAAILADIKVRCPTWKRIGQMVQLNNGLSLMIAGMRGVDAPAYCIDYEFEGGSVVIFYFNLSGTWKQYDPVSASYAAW